MKTNRDAAKSVHRGDSLCGFAGVTYLWAGRVVMLCAAMASDFWAVAVMSVLRATAGVTMRTEPERSASDLAALALD